MLYSHSHGFFLVPPRAPCRAFKNHVIKSTASPAEQKTINHPYRGVFSSHCVLKVEVITLLCNLEGLLAAQHYSLQHLMGRHMGFKVPRVPKFAHQLTKPLHQEKHDVTWWPSDLPVVLLLQKIVSQRWYVGKSL